MVPAHQVYPNNWQKGLKTKQTATNADDRKTIIAVTEILMANFKAPKRENSKMMDDDK